MKKNYYNKLINFLNKNIFYNIILFFLVLIFLQNTNTIKNIYYILVKNHDSRLAKNYENKFFSGYCEKQSHGYVIYIKNKFKNKFNKKNIPKIINIEDRRAPYWLFLNINSEINDKQVILLNYEKDKEKKINLSDYQILDNYKNRCFYLEKND
tara:strand:+ start:1002 stop:1460 length:459 start_codon:yes stop_codon:yes gene_type:complete